VLGGGIRYEDLSFRRDGRDLVLNIGQEGCHPDQIRFADWYEGNRTIDRLEIAIDTSNAYQSSSLDVLLGKQVQSFDFGALVNRFNAENDAGCGYGHSGYSQSWSLAASLMEFHLGGSDDLMTGGDLAHYYTHQGTMSGLSLGVAQVTLGDAMLGKAQQEVSSLNAQMTGAVRL